jgi:hypothetical protein
MEQTLTGFKIAFPVPDKTCTCLANTLTIAEEYIQ